jgi:hypothetical protein
MTIPTFPNLYYSSVGRKNQPFFTSPDKFLRRFHLLNKLENYRPCAEITSITAKLLLVLLREITNDG